MIADSIRSFGTQLVGVSSEPSLTIDAIDFLHDPLGPLNGRGNERLRSWAWFGIEEIFGRLQMTRHQDSSHNREHSFATLVHERSVSYSLFVRLAQSADAIKIRGGGIGSIPDRVGAKQENTAPAELRQRQHQPAS